jgi:hypothetical protein
MMTDPAPEVASSVPCMLPAFLLERDLNRKFPQNKRKKEKAKAEKGKSKEEETKPTLQSLV